MGEVTQQMRSFLLWILEKTLASFIAVTQLDKTSHLNIAIAKNSDTSKNHCTTQSKDHALPQAIEASFTDCQLAFKVASGIPHQNLRPTGQESEPLRSH